MRLLLTVLVTLSMQLYVPPATALTMAEFANICRSMPKDCSEHPVLQAYVGGALDLLATLNEQTEYLNPLYCKAPKQLFDVAAIIRFMQQQAEQYATQNAMLPLIRYFELYGGCK